MKSLLVKSMLAVLFVNLLLAGGCVSRADYDKLWAMNRTANEQLESAKDRIRLLEAEKLKLQADLADRDARIKALEDQVANLTQAKSLLEAEIERLKGEVGKGVAMPTPLPLPESLNKALQALADKYPDLLTFDKNTGMVKFKADLTFDLGSDKVKPNAEAALKEFAQIMNSPEARQFFLYIAGHTDDVRITKPETLREHKSNWGLSTDRAIAVLKVLAESSVEQVRMAALGFSKYHPIAPNAPGEKGNAANRRVEIWILPQDRVLTQPGPTVSEENIGSKLKEETTR